MPYKNCSWCGNEFSKPSVTSMKVWLEKRRFCSRRCTNQWKKTDEAQVNANRTGLSIGHAHTKENGFQKGSVPWNKGKQMSEETRTKIKLARAKQTNVHPPTPRYGSDHHNWKGGVTPLHVKIRNSKRYKKWKREVRHRDKDVCQVCKAVSSRPEVDHIKPWILLFRESGVATLKESREAEVLWDLSNGRTLCYTCHKATDTYGQKALKKIISLAI